MKPLALPLAFAVATATLAAAQAPAPPTPENTRPAEVKAAAPATKPPKTHKVEAEIVNPDVENKTLTFKTTAGEKSAPVGPLAMYRLKMVKAGDKVLLTCRDGATPEECSEVSYIKVPQPAVASPEAPRQ